MRDASRWRVGTLGGATPPLTRKHFNDGHAVDGQADSGWTITASQSTVGKVPAERPLFRSMAEAAEKDAGFEGAEREDYDDGDADRGGSIHSCNQKATLMTVMVEIDPRLVKIVRSPIYGAISARTGVSVPLLPMFLYWSGKEIPIPTLSGWSCPSVSDHLSVSSFYFMLGSKYRKVREMSDEPGAGFAGGVTS